MLPANSEIETDNLYERVRKILEAARSRVARSVNSEMVQAYWHIGQSIVEHEQQGNERAEYGRQLIESLSKRLKAEGLKGFGRRNLAWMRELYLKYPILHALRAELSWTHYRLLLKVEKPTAREFYETESIGGNWSTRELERQINSFYFERTAASQNKRQMLEDGRETSDKYQPQEFIKDPFVLEFLNLKDFPNLYNRQLKCLQKFHCRNTHEVSVFSRPYSVRASAFFATHQDIGQMMLYTNYYTREMLEEWENPTIGILLCADKNDAVVKYTLPAADKQIFAARYQLYLPTEAEILREIQEHQEQLKLTIGDNS